MGWLIKMVADRMVSGEEKKSAKRQDAIDQGVELTSRLVKQAETENFIQKLREINIQVVEIGAYGAKLIGLEEDNHEGSAADADTKRPISQNIPGEHIVLNLRWKNTGENVLHHVSFAVAFLSPEGGIIRPDALDPDPWIQKFGCAAAVRFTGRFEPGQGRMQKDMRNPFLLYHAPVERAVILGVKVELEDGTVCEKSATL